MPDLSLSNDNEMKASSSPAPAPAKWMQFLVGDTDALPLRVFEVLFTSSFLLWMTRCFIGWREWLTDWGFHLTLSELRAMGYPEPIPLPPSGGYVIGLAVLISGASLALIVNRGRRLALATLFACAIYVQGVDFMAAVTINKLFVAVFGILLISPGYSRNTTTGRLQVSLVAIRALQASLILQYLASGISKAFVGDWLKHGDVLYTQVQGVFRTDFAAWMLRLLPVWSWSVMQWMSLLFELEAPVLFCVRKLRLVAMIYGISMHLMIALMMKNLIFFSSVMWTFYALFITADEWRSLGSRMKGLVPRLIVKRA